MFSLVLQFVDTQHFFLKKQMQHVEIEYPLLCFYGLEAVTFLTVQMNAPVVWFNASVCAYSRFLGW